MAPNTTQVCDNCRLRKTKCDRGNPCSCCVNYVIPCTYKHNPQRRGPKGGKGKRLTMIKLGMGTQPSSPLSPSTSPTNTVSPSSAPLGPASLFPCSLEKLSTIVTAHVHIFMARIFPIMPVVDELALLRDAAQIGSLSAARYAVLLSLVATTRIQLKLDEDRALESALLEPDDTVSREISGTQLLAAAEAAHLQSNVVDNMSLDSVLTCFFLFTANGNLERHGKAWFYLGQAISVGSIIGINRNDTSGKIAPEEVETRRALFWLIFISERTYALQQRHPILLRGKVPKPSVTASSHPLIMNDFVNHSRLFEGLPENMYEWDSEHGDISAEAARSHEAITSVICAVEPSNSMIESQQFDTLVTQQWLRIAMWRLAYSAAPSNAKLPSLTIPFDAGKAIMTALNSVSQHSKDCHGISIEQKLFDIGTCLVDTAPFSSPEPTSMILGPQDLLHNIVKTLGCIRGVQSHLLPDLLNHSQKMLGLTEFDAWSETHWLGDLETGFVVEDPLLFGFDETATQDEATQL